ncbi:MAG: TraB/GumN family protein [Pseudomonadota bacterium]
MRITIALAATLVCFFPFASTAQDACPGTDLIAALPDDKKNALIDQADEIAFGKGLLWRATRGETVIDLFGTYHFRHQETQTHLERLKPLIELADTVFLEISNDDQSAMQRRLAEDPGIMFITEGPTLPDLLGPEDWPLLATEMQARGIPSIVAAKFKPLWATLMLGIGPCEARAGAFEGGGIDTRVGDYAGSIGNPSQSLEDFADLLALLDQLPLDDQLDMIRLSLAWPGDTNNLSYTIRSRYLAEEIAVTLVFSEYVSSEFGGDAASEDFDQLMALLLDKRNSDWMDVIRAELSDTSRLFIAVGAGHLPGEIGLLRLLEKEGFAIERLPL